MRKVFTVFFTGLIMMANTVCAQVQSRQIFIRQVGQFEVILLSEKQGLGSEGILIGATAQMRNKYIPSGTFPNATNAFLIKTPEHIILVDAGTQSASLLSNLGTVGVSPEEIDIILITHAHGDHIGGLLENDREVFPNAKIYIPQPEYDYWTNDHIMQELEEANRGGFLLARKVFMAYKDHLNLFQPRVLEDEEINRLLPGILPVAAYGHTPGHTMYQIESDNKRLLIWGDLTHAMAIQMPHPSVAVTFDVNPEAAITIRKKVLDYVFRNNIPVAGMHIPFPGMGTVSESSSGGYELLK